MENVIIEVPEYIRVCMLGEYGEFLGTVDLPPEKIKDCSWQAQVEPPEVVGLGQAAVLNREDNTWQLVSDYRGTTVWDTKTKKEVIVDYLGELKEKHSFDIGTTVGKE